jgi:hypothetical protein
MGKGTFWVRFKVLAFHAKGLRFKCNADVCGVNSFNPYRVRILDYGAYHSSSMVWIVGSTILSIFIISAS